MQPEQIRELLENVKAGTAGIDEAFVRLAELPFCDLGDAKIDNHRALRCGFAEVVLCRGKEPRDVTRILEEGLRSSPMMLATRAEKKFCVGDASPVAAGADMLGRLGFAAVCAQ